MDESIEFDKNKNEELDIIYKIFKEIYLKAPPILKDLSIDIDYKEYINDPIDFKKIEKKFQDEKYSSLTDAIKDIRLVFLNCYKYFGTKSDHTLKSLKLEELLENKISVFDEQFKSLADIQLTLNLLNLDRVPSSKFRYPKDCYDSVLLKCVAHCRYERLKEYHKVLSSTLTTDVDNVHILEELVSWEHEIYFNDHYRYISSMWELPEIGNFVAIIFKELDLDIINQGEIERMFLMPKESTTMSQIMTTLLMPIKKNKFNGQIMPYKVWSDKLSKKVSDWYKAYEAKKQNKVSVMNSHGIHPDFWLVIGNKNPLIDSDYCKLSYFMKVWLVKGLCDHVASKYKTINDIISNCNERQSTIWKNDMETEEYFFFSSMPDLRIYYYNITYDEPSLEFLELEKCDKVLKEEDALSISCIPSLFHDKLRVKPDEKQFKLIADSVQGLRSFINELDTEDSSVPDNLISALEDFLFKIEPEENNLIILNNNSKIKLYKDWKSYPERFKKDEDDISLWKEKKFKSSSIVADGEIIFEKRKRKSVIKPDFDIDINLNETDEELFGCGDESVDDFTDSEDEWGAMNQSKNKAKAPIQAQSKLAELENRLRKEDKCSKNLHRNNEKMFDSNDNSLDFDKLNENDVGKKKLIDENHTDKKVKRKNSTNIFVNGVSEEFVSLQNIDGTNNEIEVSSDEEVVSMGIEKEENKTSHTHQKQKFVFESDKCKNEQPEIKKIKSSDLNKIDIVVLDDDKLESCEIIKSASPVSIISNSSVEEKETSEQDDSTKNKSVEFCLNKDDVISIEDDDDKIVISDDDDDIQFISTTPKRQVLPIKIGRPYTLNNNSNKTFNPISRNKRLTTTNHIRHQVASTSIPKLSPNISIMPANVHVPKGIEVTMVKRPQNTIPSHFNVTKRAAIRSNTHLTKNSSYVNVQCKVISKPNSNGEVKFFISLPNGNLHPVSDELMNQYLKEHNNRLPDYWLVPLPQEVAKQYGFN